MHTCINMKKNKLKKDFTYYAIIKEAIESYPYRRATAEQIFNYITGKHPGLFMVWNSMTWKGNIRQMLSKNPEFVKIKMETSRKLNWWTYKPMDELEAEERALRKMLSSPPSNGKYVSFYGCDEEKENIPNGNYK
ncbi:hypothetical protein ENBRE01_0565 [Enteropsectra breve]|nr:hypothetical protein ENBRE01_0565 [Enteropsectra breve]